MVVAGQRDAGPRAAAGGGGDARGEGAVVSLPQRVETVWLPPPTLVEVRLGAVTPAGEAGLNLGAEAVQTGLVAPASPPRSRSPCAGGGVGARGSEYT